MDFRIFFYFYEECHQNFDEDYIESIDCFLLYSHFHNINSADSQMESLSPSTIFFNSFIQTFIVFIVEVFYLRG
jgi:hypothetical protein